MQELDPYIQLGRSLGCSQDQMANFVLAGQVLQPRQLAASAAARSCDAPDGPTAVGYGGARGGGKSHWLLAQMGADDCQRFPGLKCLLLRKVGKSNLEHFQDLRLRVFSGLDHQFAAHRGELVFANGSRIVASHYQTENEIDAYLGLEYDIIGVEEATTLTSRKYRDIATCCRSSKTFPDGRPWRPRIYSTTNPGGIGHAWYRSAFIQPFLQKRETDTRFIPARVDDNRFNNPEYRRILQSLGGWQRRAWFEGDWDIAAGQFFVNFRQATHVIDDFDDRRAREWWAALDYGFNHYTVVLLACRDDDGNVFVVDEHAQRLWIPERHAAAIHAMLARYRIRLNAVPETIHRVGPHQFALVRHRTLARFLAGPDVFTRQANGLTVADQYQQLGISLSRAGTDRINGWASITARLGDPAAGIAPRLFIHRRCSRLIDTLPLLQHDPNNPEDVLKVDIDEDGLGGDDAADALRYLVGSKPRVIIVQKLRGL